MHSTLQTWATEVLPAARATVVSFFAGSLFVGSSLAALMASGLADEGRYGVLFAAAAVLAVPLGTAAPVVPRRRRPGPSAPPPPPDPPSWPHPPPPVGPGPPAGPPPP